jgi:hypothetical protein
MFEKYTLLAVEEKKVFIITFFGCAWQRVGSMTALIKALGVTLETVKQGEVYLTAMNLN